MQDFQPTILSYVKDLPNLCSLAGLACTILAIYFSILGVFYATMIAMIWAVAFDWADGLIARRMKGRTGNDRTFGGQLDVLIDIVSYGVAPSILLMSYGKFEPIFLVGAFIMLSASAIRLSYFSTYGLSDDSNYPGLALDNNNIILVFIFLFESFITSRNAMSYNLMNSRRKEEKKKNKLETILTKNTKYLVCMNHHIISITSKSIIRKEEELNIKTQQKMRRFYMPIFK